MKRLAVAAIAVLFLLSACSSGPGYSTGEVDTFAQCITEAGAVMYGAFWCPHCARTKKNFGSSFQYINYVECDPRGDNEESERCLEEKIEKYDTWRFADGSEYISEPSFEILAERTGCPLPQQG